jgi:bifunctional DNase/RNase
MSLSLRWCRQLWLLFGAVLLAVSLDAGARELAAEVDDMIEVEVATLGLAGPGGPPVVLLREPGAQEVIPISIGANEAGAILRGLSGERSPRPMTHDLLSDVLDEVDVTLERVYVDAIVGHTFFGMLELSLPGRDERLRIDSRPSDAIALAIYAGASIRVAPQVLEAARDIEYQGLNDEVVVALGITVAPVTDDLREALNLPDRPGVLVNDVHGPAAEAGLRPGALLLEVNGEAPDTPLHYLELVRDTAVDENVRLRYWQEGEERELQVTTDVPPRQPMPKLQEDVPGIRT